MVDPGGLPQTPIQIHSKHLDKHMRTTIHKSATRLMCLPVLAVLTFGMPETRLEKSELKEQIIPALGDASSHLNNGGNQVYHTSIRKCSSPVRPLFRPGYGNR